ncbi:MAG: hypothetical protein R3C24_18275 [Cyanobacteriota/Melainabacteria group bacterium]
MKRLNKVSEPTLDFPAQFIQNAGLSVWRSSHQPAELRCQSAGSGKRADGMI